MFYFFDNAFTSAQAMGSIITEYIIQSLIECSIGLMFSFNILFECNNPKIVAAIQPPARIPTNQCFVSICIKI